MKTTLNIIIVVLIYLIYAEICHLIDVKSENLTNLFIWITLCWIIVFIRFKELLMTKK